MNLRFDQPGFLWLALLVVPLVLASWPVLATMDRLRRATVIGIRSALIILLAVTLAGPRTVREHDELTVIGILDLSGSVKRFAALADDEDLGSISTVEYLRSWFRDATAARTRDDRFGLIVFDGKATVISVPVRGEYVDDNLDVSVLDGTNIAEAIRLALAMFPADSARRIVLVSDGNETMGDAIAAAREAAAGREGGAGVPIDVAPVMYEVAGDVQVARVEAPPTAQPGQVVTVRIVIDATAPASGRIELRREDAPVDLNGAAPGVTRRVELPAGRSVHLAQVKLGDTPINRFEATFEADDAEQDALLVNNRGESFTATPSRGTVLVLTERIDDQRPLARALRRFDIPVQLELPAALGEDLLTLQRYDLIVLENVAAPELTELQQKLLVRYVHDLGGGLVMVGGPQSFGAGGWNGTELENVLPVELDPPKELKLARAALVLVLDKSGSMNEPVAGTRTTQQRIANEAAALAIESLRRESLVGVVTFDLFAREHVPLQRNDDPEAIADRLRAIRSDGGTNLEPALERARRMLESVDAERKLVVCLSDGRSHVTELDDLVERMADEGIMITTIAVGDEADHDTLARIAELGGGEFYPVRNPRTLPRVLVDSVQVINKPLLKERPFSPVVRPTGSVLTAGMGGAPPLGGLVITTARPDVNATIEMTDPDGEPLLAHWQVGLGRAAAFTSDSGAQWAGEWLGWPGYAPFWAQLARTIARPATAADAELTTRIENGRLRITLESSGEEAMLDYVSVEGVVYDPEGESEPVTLPQIAPGRYQTSVAAPKTGTYVVALSPRRGTRRLAPVIGGATQASSAEYRRYESNPRLLARVMELTGGRALDLARPMDAELFDREGMQPSRTALPAWGILLWLAVGLLLLDVAARRVAWDATSLRRALARASARVAPSHVRGRAAAETLASLRQASAQADERRARPAVSARERKKAERAVPVVRRAEPTTSAPEPRQVSAALDALRGRDTEPSEKPGAPEPEPADENEGSTDTTSSLLAAKRRARRKLDA